MLKVDLQKTNVSNKIIHNDSKCFTQNAQKDK